MGILALLAVLVVAGISRKKKDAGISVTTEKALTKTITQTVTANGKVQPEIEVKITPEVAGEIIDLPFKEGDVVKKGELLLRIKDDNYRYQVDQREADLAAAHAAAIQSHARLLQAREDFKRSRDLHRQKLIPESEYTNARTTVEVAEANEKSAQAQVRRAEGLLKQSQDQLEKTTIYAPMDGTISLLPVEVGERVAGTGQFNAAEVMRVADLANMEVVVKVNENDVVNVKVGNPAEINIDAFPKRKFSGKVTEIASSAVTTGANTQAEVTNFEVRIRIDADGALLKPGMSALADIATATVNDVIAVPIQSVTVRSRDSDKTVEQVAAEREKARRANKGEGAVAAQNVEAQREEERRDRDKLRRVVFVVEGDKVKQVDVETGLADTTHLEIKNGIEAGQEVVSGSYATITRVLKDGMVIKQEPGRDASKGSESGTR